MNIIQILKRKKIISRNFRIKNYYENICNEIINQHNNKINENKFKAVTSGIAGVIGAGGTIIAVTEIIVLTTVAAPVAVIGAIAFGIGTIISTINVKEIHDKLEIYKDKCEQGCFKYDIENKKITIRTRVRVPKESQGSERIDIYFYSDNKYLKVVFDKTNIITF